MSISSRCLLCNIMFKSLPFLNQLFYAKWVKKPHKEDLLQKPRRFMFKNLCGSAPGMKYDDLGPPVNNSCCMPRQYISLQTLFLSLIYFVKVVPLIHWLTHFYMCGMNGNIAFQVTFCQNECQKSRNSSPRLIMVPIGLSPAWVQAAKDISAWSLFPVCMASVCEPSNNPLFAMQVLFPPQVIHPCTQSQ